MTVAQAPIPFVSNQESGWEELAGASPAAINIVVDGKGAVRKRPGLSAADGVFSGVVSNGGVPLSAVYRVNDGRVFAVADYGATKRIYLVTATGKVELTGVVDMQGSLRPIIAETESQLVLAAGRNMHRILLSDLTCERMPGGPPVATHVIAHNSRLLANDTQVIKTAVSYTAPSLGSATAGNEQWGSTITALGSSGFFTAEARPDPVVAIADNTNEVFCFGTTTLQNFGSDDSAIFAPTTTHEYGCAAPYSVIRQDASFGWLTNPRRFVVSNGRSLQDVSAGIKGTLDELERVDDMFGYRVLTNLVDALAWTSPSDGRTFVFQSGGWSTWMAWDEAAGVYTRLPVNCSGPFGNDCLAGTTGGKILRWDSNALTDDGGRIVASITTGFQSHETDRKKQCLAARFVLRRGESAVAPVAFLSFRDDQGPFSSPIPISMGDSSDREVVVVVRQLGVYRRRQWRWTFSDTANHVLAAASEEYEVLSS